MNILNLPKSAGIRLALQLLVLILIISLAVMARAGKPLSSTGQSSSNTTKLLTQ